MNPYPNICHYCNSPANKNKNILICSNVKCKSWKNIRKASADINIDYSRMKQEQGLTSDDPIIVRCPKCNVPACPSGINAEHGAYCFICHCWVSFNCIVDRWYYSKTPSNTYSSKYVGAPNYWEYGTEVKNVK